MIADMYIQRFRQLDLTFFSSEDTHVVFSPETLQIFRVGKQAARLLHDLRFARALEDYTNADDENLPALQRLAGYIVDAVSNSGPVVAPEIGAIASGRPLPKLALIVNNYCNLQCTYCYEHETMFRLPAHSMTIALAELVLAKFYSSFGGLGKLMFIGGEPTLNTEVIAAACERATTLAEEWHVNPPAFSMITNGFKLDDSTLKLLKQYHIQTTFSVDGPKKVNDLVRISNAGIGSFDRASSNLKRYRNDVNAEIGVECTVTQAHHDAGVTVVDLLEFAGSEMGVSAPHIAPAGVKPQSSLYPYREPKLAQQFREAGERSVDNVIARMTGASDRTYPALESVLGMLSMLIKRKGTNGMCPAGTTQLAVDCHGDIYPCWMFAGIGDYRMGNICTDEIFNEQARSTLARIAHNTKRANLQCSRCFARYLCSSCIGNNHNTTGSFETIDEGFCDTVRATAEAVVVKIAKTREDPERWNTLLAYANQARLQKTESCE